MLLLCLGAIHHQALATDDVVGTDNGAKSRRRPVESPVLSWNNQAEQAKFTYLLDNGIRDAIFLDNLLLEGN